MENNSQFIIFRNRNADPQASSLQDEPSSDRCAVSQDSNMSGLHVASASPIPHLLAANYHYHFIERKKEESPFC
eukprot:1156861-Pelagomonas_calceolata.AAC.1